MESHGSTHERDLVSTQLHTTTHNDRSQTRPVFLFPSFVGSRFVGSRASAPVDDSCCLEQKTSHLNRTPFSEHFRVHFLGYGSGEVGFLGLRYGLNVADGDVDGTDDERYDRERGGDLHIFEEADLVTLLVSHPADDNVGRGSNQGGISSDVCT